MYIDVLNCDCGSISHAFGVLVSGFTYTHVNCNLECIRLLFVCMLIYQTKVEGIIILRRSSTSKCLMWLLKFFTWRWTTNFRTRLPSQLHNKSSTFIWKNFSNYTRHSFVELPLRIIIIPSTFTWYININKNRSLIHSKLQFTCICVQPSTNTRNA
jgi:hypothetical protein